MSLSCSHPCLAPSVALFVCARVIGGIGLGAVAPNIASYLMEVLPGRWRSQLTTLAHAALALGGVICALANKVLLPIVGLRGMFLAGGLLPLLLLPLLLIPLPESPPFLVARRAG